MTHDSFNRVLQLFRKFPGCLDELWYAGTGQLPPSKLQAFPKIIQQVLKGGFRLAAEGMHVCHHRDPQQSQVETLTLTWNRANRDTHRNDCTANYTVFMEGKYTPNLWVIVHPMFTSQGFPPPKYFWHLYVICVKKISLTTYQICTK